MLNELLADPAVLALCRVGTSQRWPQLARLDRYERRALSRRKSAVRALDALPRSAV